jgi:hypothetical protein
MAFSGMINVKSGQLTFGGQFEAYKRGQLERNIQVLQETTDIKQLIVAQKYTRIKTAEFNKLAEELNIAESVEEMINALK